VLDLSTKQFSTVAATGDASRGDMKYAGAVGVGSKVFFVPSSQNNIGVLDTSTLTFSSVATTERARRGRSKYGGGVAVGNKIYFSPASQDNIGVFDVSEMSFATIDSPRISLTRRRRQARGRGKGKVKGKVKKTTKGRSRRKGKNKGKPRPLRVTTSEDRAHSVRSPLQTNPKQKPYPGPSKAPQAGSAPARGNVEFKFSCDSMLNDIVRDLDFVSVGQFKLDLGYSEGEFHSPDLAGTICLGSDAACQQGKPTKENLVGRLMLQYDTTAGYVFYTKMAVQTLDIRRLISIVGDKATADKLPSAFTNLKFKTLRDGCNTKSTNECYVFMAFAQKAVTTSFGPPKLKLQPGFTVFASIDWFGQTSVLQARVPVSHATASWEFAVSAVDGGRSGLKRVNFNRLENIFQFTRLKKAEHGKYLKCKMSFYRGVDFVINSLAYEVPAAGRPMKAAFNLVKSPIQKMNKFLAKAEASYEVINTFGVVPAPRTNYVGLKGESKDGAISIKVLASRDKKKNNAFMGFVGVETAAVGTFMKQVIGTNPFKTLRAFSNMRVSALLASDDMLLPEALPKPFHRLTTVKKGVCIHGILNRPKRCGRDTLCTIVSNALAGRRTSSGKRAAHSNLALSGCFTGTTAKLALLIGGEIKVTKRSDSPILKGLSLTFETNGGHMTLGGEANLEVTMRKSKVTFTGTVYGKMGGSSMVLGLKLSASGMIPQAFGFPRLHLFDLYLEAEVGLKGPALTLTSFVVGGGICIGGSRECKSLIGSAPAEETLIHEETLTANTMSDEADLSEVDENFASTISMSMKKKRAADAKKRARERRVALLQKKKVPGAFAAKLYVGMRDGLAFFYASLSKVSFGDIAAALVGSKISKHLPKWISTITVEGYDAKACKRGVQSACWAYASFSPKMQKISLSRTQSPLTIPQGIGLSARLNLLGVSMGLKLTLDTNRNFRLNLQLQGPALKLAGKMLVISKSKREQKDGPQIEVDVDANAGRFTGKFDAYMKFGVWGEGDIKAVVDMRSFKCNATKVKLLNGAIKADVYVEMPVDNPKRAVVDVSIGVKPISKGIKTVARTMSKPIQALSDSIEQAMASIAKKFKKAKTALQKMQATLDAALVSCKVKTAEFKCQEIRCNAMNSAAAYLCRQGLSVLSYGLSAVCEAPIIAAKGAVSVAQTVLKPIQKAYDVASSAVKKGVSVAKDAVKLLTKITLKKLGFKAELGNAKVTLSASLKMGGKVEKYQLTLDFGVVAKNAGKLAYEMGGKVLKAGADAAKKTINDLINKVTGAKTSMERSVEEIEMRMDADAQKIYREANEEAERDMYTESRDNQVRSTQQQYEYEHQSILDMLS